MNATNDMIKQMLDFSERYFAEYQPVSENKKPTQAMRSEVVCNNTAAQDVATGQVVNLFRWQPHWNRGIPELVSPLSD